MPWGSDVYNAVVLGHRGFLGLRGFLALWTLATLLDANTTLKYLAYLGYTYFTGEETQSNALQVTRWMDAFVLTSVDGSNGIY